MAKIEMQDTSLHQWASFLREHGLANITLFLLDATRPLHPLLSQALHVFSPFLPLSSLQHLLEDPQYMNELIFLLEE